MSRRVKPPAPRRGPKRGAAAPPAAALDVAEFFAGVDDLRAFLDRSLQDPAHQERRLAAMARALLKPRGVAELCVWLAEETREAVGARACTVALVDEEWRPWIVSGLPVRPPPAELCVALRGPFSPAAPPGPRAIGPDLLVPLAGMTRVPACLWLELDATPAPASVALLGALAATAGVIVEQELSAELLRRDPVTGLWAESAFLEQAEALISRARRERRAAILLACRLVGLDAVRAAQGISAAQEALRALAAAGEEVWPEELRGMRFANLTVLMVGDDAGALAAAMNERARALAGALRRRSAAAGPPLAVATLWAPVWPDADLRRLVEHLCRRADSATTPGVSQLGA